MTDDQKVNAVRIFVEAHYNSMAEAFRKTPSANAWLNLQEAMWAHQFAKLPISKSESVLIKIAEENVIGEWVSLLAKESKARPT